jgi:hypothetical protein
MQNEPMTAEQREQAIAELEEEIADQLRYCKSLESSSESLVGASCRSGELMDELDERKRKQRSINRALARLNAILEDKKKGMIG